MRYRKTVVRALVLAVLLALTGATVACDVETYVGVSYGYPGWYGPCCWGGPAAPGWGGGYIGGPVW